MKKPTKSPRIRFKQKVLVGGLVLFVVLAGVAYGVERVCYYNRVANRATIVEIRELILLAVRGVKKDAPVDAKTGDVYFPEAKLYLPNPGIALSMTYLYDSGDIADAHSELSVSTYPVRGTESLYQAQDTKQLFAAVPNLQACSRGVKIVHQPFPATDTVNQLRQTVPLKNGTTVYVYLEKGCPELATIADMFAKVQSY